jgi:hypothetical protein
MTPAAPKLVLGPRPMAQKRAPPAYAEKDKSSFTDGFATEHKEGAPPAVPVDQKEQDVPAYSEKDKSSFTDDSAAAQKDALLLANPDEQPTPAYAEKDKSSFTDDSASEHKEAAPPVVMPPQHAPSHISFFKGEHKFKPPTIVQPAHEPLNSPAVPLTMEEYAKQRIKEGRLSPGFLSVNSPGYILRYVSVSFFFSLDIATNPTLTDPKPSSPSSTCTASPATLTGARRAGR